MNKNVYNHAIHFITAILHAHHVNPHNLFLMISVLLKNHKVKIANSFNLIKIQFKNVNKTVICINM